MNVISLAKIARNLLKSQQYYNGNPLRCVPGKLINFTQSAQCKALRTHDHSYRKHTS